MKMSPALLSVLGPVFTVAVLVVMLLSIFEGVSAAGLDAWMGRHQLRTMDGWSEIEDEHPVVKKSVFGYVIVTDGGVYDTNLSAEPELRNLLARLAE